MAVRRSRAADRYAIRQPGITWSVIDDRMSSSRIDYDYERRVARYLRERNPSARMGLSAG